MPRARMTQGRAAHEGRERGRPLTAMMMAQIRQTPMVSMICPSSKRIVGPYFPAWFIVSGQDGVAMDIDDAHFAPRRVIAPTEPPQTADRSRRHRCRGFGHRTTCARASPMRRSWPGRGQDPWPSPVLDQQNLSFGGQGHCCPPRVASREETGDGRRAPIFNSEVDRPGRLCDRS